MSSLNNIKNKFFTLEELAVQSQNWKNDGEKIVFTNGCFDVVHKGHVEVLARTSDLGDKLIIGLNSDVSISNIKGPSRPIIDEDSRKLLLAAFSFIDAIVLFDEETPYNLINTLKPDVLAKGGDYKIKDIVGADIVKAYGGHIITVPLTPNFSSSNIIDRIKNS